VGTNGADGNRHGKAFDGLRNVAITPPYFHDGSAPTLNEAVRRMASAQLDQALSDQQVEAIVAFLSTLTGTYRGASLVAAPR